MVLEERSRAVSRGAKIYAEVRGYGCAADAHHITQPPRDGAGAALAMATGDVPPTLNLDDPCSECVPDGADFVRRVAARGVRVRAAMTNSFGFGGTNASLVFAAPPRLRG